MSSEQGVELIQSAERLKAQGRFTEAEAAFRCALQANPQSPALWWSLGDLYAQTANFSGVEHCCRQIVSLNPDLPEVWLYLGMALQRQNRLEEAESALQSALRLNPGLVDGHYQLGIVQQSLGRNDAAIASYGRALDGVSDRAPVLFNLSVLYQDQGRLREAFEHAFEALRCLPQTLKYRRQFATLLRQLSPDRVSEQQLAEILRCFDTPGLDTSVLMKPCMLLLARDPGFSRALAAARQETPERFQAEAGRRGMAPLFDNQLLRRLLLHTKISSPEFESLLCALRRAALARAGGDTADWFGAAGGFMEALACQCFNTDYAALRSRGELDGLADLAARIDANIAQGVAVDDAFLLRLAVYCMYRPLSSLARIEELMGYAGATLRDALPLIVRRQWDEYREEQAIRDGLDVLTPISGGVSTQVRQQYEESPYPRWFSVDLHEPVSCRDFLQPLMRDGEPPEFFDASVDILVAGCGTGHHAIVLAAGIADSRMLAVDLSRASLAYAKRKATEAGVRNIRFAQADILELGSLGRRFHVVESVGVLHHMREPVEGMKVLSGLLVEGGAMRLGLYSRLGRQAVAAARTYVAEQGFEATPDGIRAAREAMLALEPAHPAYPVTRYADFYTLSECRDLVFHVQEQCLSLAEVAAMLDACGLAFAGFSIGDPETVKRYQARYPDDVPMTDLANWAEFESEVPDAFEDMYQFWCRKI
jgi:2-polyprenyl-3-methyl-5-hydroxy-6-metoxy-1,4-benzoquinol methylase/Flp pilus assembly protein TadD